LQLLKYEFRTYNIFIESTHKQAIAYSSALLTLV